MYFYLQMTYSLSSSRPVPFNWVNAIPSLRYPIVGLIPSHHHDIQSSGQSHPIITISNRRVNPIPSSRYPIVGSIPSNHHDIQSSGQSHPIITISNRRGIPAYHSNSSQWRITNLVYLYFLPNFLWHQYLKNPNTNHHKKSHRDPSWS